MVPQVLPASESQCAVLHGMKFTINKTLHLFFFFFVLTGVHLAPFCSSTLSMKDDVLAHVCKMFSIGYDVGMYVHIKDEESVLGSALRFWLFDLHAMSHISLKTCT
jgi:hypothetical protein